MDSPETLETTRPSETLETKVIRQLGLELAQAHVDRAYLHARLVAAQEIVRALLDGIPSDEDTRESAKQLYLLLIS